MNANAHIPIHVVGDQAAPQREGIGGGLKAILYEILAMLENLAAYGEKGQIDLRSLPLAPGEYENLKAALGKGEAEVRLDIAGLTECVETVYPGVWWVKHRDPTGNIAAEFIEVTGVPEILVPETREIRDGISRLERQIEDDGRNKGVA